MSLQSDQTPAPQAPDTQAPESPAKQKKEPKNLKKEILSWILTLGTAVIVALLIRTFIFEPIRVDGNSMNDTLLNNEFVFVTKTEYLFGDPQRQDVVICRYPNRSEYFVKRLIGLPGDTIAIEGNKVYINGELLDEPYLSDRRTLMNHTMAPVTLGENEYFVMGDNRDNSNDSRNTSGPKAVGTLSRNMIVGHVRFVFYPFSEIRGIQ